ncbi:hypothetical protein M5K25_022912 [Dendrobium thyrsiflorum]|uniref:Uncharacterized protein n=1 Tax=Dendrobium thyrsiflorum TaxID=117978 RepID=A0ABD0U715_DENTH
MVMRTSDHGEFTRTEADDLRPRLNHFIFELSFVLDPERDHGFVFDDQGFIDIHRSPFFDVDLEIDHSVEDYVERIIYSLATAIDQRQPSVQ